MTDLERYNKDKATVMSMIKFILMIALICGLLFIGTKLVAILVPFIIGFLLAKTSFAIASPIAEKIAKPNRVSTVKRKLSIFIYVLLLFFVALVIVWACIKLFSQGMKAIDAITAFALNFDTSGFNTEYIQKFSAENGGFLTAEMIAAIEDNVYKIFGMVVEKIPSIVAGIFSTIWNMIGNLPYVIFVVVTVIFSGYYFINDGPSVLRAYLKNVPNKAFRKKTVSLLNDLSVTLFRALGGYLSLLIITAVEAWFAFTLAGVNYAIILALITAVIDFLPVLGVSATMIPTMIYLAMHENYRGIIILVIAMAVMTVIRRFIEPPILGKSLHLHPLLMLLGMALGVYIWGAIGFLLGPTMLIIILDVCHVFEIDKKIMAFMSRVLSDFMKKPDKEAAEA